MFINKEDVQWRKVRYLKTPLAATDDEATWEMEIELPEPLASWDVFSYWERERYESMKVNLKKGDVLFDIGTEQGWLNIAYAKLVGPENMVLIEPTKEFWPNIRAIWEKNGLAKPRGVFTGLLGSKAKQPGTKKQFFGRNKWREWPELTNGPLIDKNKYQYIHEHEKGTIEIKLDDYVRYTQITPTALTMDVEGAELLVLKGTKRTLCKYKPKVWVSIHPDMGERDYGVKPGDVLEFMENLGYKSYFLGEDHERHFYFEPVL